MDAKERQFLLTAAWLFMRHGQNSRAQNVCEALVEDDPRDGAAAAALAGLLLDGGDAARAVDVLRAADAAPGLEYADAVLETRALRALGRAAEAQARWKRHLESQKGAARKWMA